MRIKVKISLIQFCILMSTILCFTGLCIAEQGYKFIANGDGSQLKLPAEINRVAALWGPSYEKVAMLGAESKIVACTGSHKKIWPWANVVFKNLENIQPISVSSPSFEVNVEELIKVNPDVVFNWSFPQSVQKVAIAGYPSVYPANTQGVGYVKDILMMYANALGKNETKRAKLYTDYFDSRLEIIASRTRNIPEADRPRVFFAMGDPLKCDGKASPLPQYIELAGGNCVHKNIPGNFGQKITIEQLALWDPQYIFIDMAGVAYYGKKEPHELLASIAGDEKFQTISAIKNKNVYASPTGVFFWSAGQQVILQVMWVAKKLHPDLFADLNMESELIKFYKDFFDYDLNNEQIKKILLRENP